MARKTQTEKGHEILNKKSVFPAWNPLDYDGSLSRNLTFYRADIDDAVKKAVFIAYCKKFGKDTSRIAKLSDGWFITCGAVAHITTRGIDLESKHLTWLLKKFTELDTMKAELDDEKADVAPAPTKDEKLNFEAGLHIAEFEGGVDEIIKGRTFDAKSYLIRNNVKPPVMKLIAAWFKPRIKELREYDTDEQVKEAYSHLTKREFIKYREQIEGMVAACETASMIVKAARKPRAKKAKAPAVVAKGVKYMKEHAELKLTSITPEKMVDKDEVWLFNIKVRRLFRYVAVQGMKLSVKGTTLTGFDPEKSGGKILRKPEVQLKGVESMTSRPLTKLYNDVRAVASKPTGRINEDCVILKAF